MADDVAFVDSNIWLYAFISGSEINKHKQSKELLASIDEIVLSNQVVAEVSVNLIRKTNVTEEEIQELTSDFGERYIVESIDIGCLLLASSLR